ncbi:coadhesin-like [Lineus longissimus]|uniref:coadhesin-like n=1 Tax=Lineus longissimus TaxID=88925 RepID=UPI00315D7D56
MSYVTYGCHDAIECPPLPQHGEPTKWHAYNGHCYGSHTQHLPYPESERICKTYPGGHLFSLYWEEEFMELRQNDVLYGVGYGDRLGIRFNPSNREYTYADGHLILFHDWIFTGLTGYLLSPGYGKGTCFYRPREVTKGVQMEMCADPNVFICKVPNQACINPVGLQDPNLVPNTAITASTYVDDAHAPQFARLNGQSAWCARSAGKSVDSVDFLQIDLGHLSRLFGVMTQGLGSYWVTKYQVHASIDMTTWQPIRYQWGDRDFPGNRDGSIILTNYFRWITLGRYVRIVVKGWQGMPSLRAELLACRVDGGWSQWNQWGPCSSSCGRGRQQRSRSCSNPPALYGGTICKGVAVEDRTCSPQPCPVNGMWSSWSPWGPCSAFCGEGNRTRTRRCDDPGPAHSGHACRGQRSEQEKCIRSNCLEGVPSCPFLLSAVFLFYITVNLSSISQDASRKT